MSVSGIGDAHNLWLVVYCPNRPPLPAFQTRTGIAPAGSDELAQIVAATGNHWRKIFNLYAKLLHRLAPQSERWQDDRDKYLLQAGSGTLLLFSPPLWPAPNAVHLVMGKAHATASGLTLETLPDLGAYDEHFTFSPTHRLILTPYFDYRQLSNARLEQLAQLIETGFL